MDTENHKNEQENLNQEDDAMAQQAPSESTSNDSSSEIYIDWNLDSQTEEAVEATTIENTVSEEVEEQRSFFTNTQTGKMDMEPIVLIDKSRGKEAHIIVNVRNNFEELIHSAKKINTGLFQGEWALSYVDATTKKIMPVSQEAVIGDFVNQEINTFFWSYNKRKSTFRSPGKGKKGYKERRTSRKDYNAENYKKDRYQKKAEYYQKKADQEEKKAAQKAEYYEKKKAYEQKRQHNQGYKKRPATGGGYMAYADLGKRVAAWMIDLVIIGFVVGFSFKVFRGGGVIIPVWLYYALMESSEYQATLGKMAMNLKVTDLEGNRLSFGRATGRFFAKWISQAIAGLGYVMAFFTEKRQTLHDMIASCIVVESDRK